MGNLLFAGYERNDGTACMAPGHSSVLHDTDGSRHLVAHIREKNFTGTPELSAMRVRKLYRSKDGWPYSASEIYAKDMEREFAAEE